MAVKTKKEVEITLLMLWKEKTNRNGKITPEIIDFSIEKKPAFIESIGEKQHLQVVKVPSKFFFESYEKQIKILIKLADKSKIEKFLTVANLIQELQKCENQNAIITIASYDADEEERYMPVIDCVYDGRHECFEIQDATYEYYC